MAKNELDIFNCLFNYYEVRSELQNGQIFIKVIDEINRRLNASFKYSYDFDSVEDYEQNIAAGVFAINSLVFDDDYQKFILALLGNNHYYMKIFIKDLIKKIGNAKSQEEREIVIDQYQRLLLINNIKFNGVDKYTIQSAYGDYSFLLADQVLTDEEIISYIKSGEHQKTCHENAAMLLDYSDAYCVCSLARNYFVDWYYHSYSYLEENDLVLDICSNSLTEKKTFDDLFSPKEIFFMRSEDLKRIYFDKIKNIKSEFDECSYFKCALYLQAQKLEDNPEEKKRVLDFNNTILQGMK